MNNEGEIKKMPIEELVDIRQRMTELNRSAIANKLAEEELIKSEERYRNFVELSPDMIALHSRGKYVYVNPAGIKLLGASGPGDLIGKSILKTIHPSCIEIVKERIRRLEQGKGVPLLEEKFIRLDGTIVDVEVAASPIFFQGEPVVQVIAKDITERKRMEEALRRSEEAAQRLAQENAIIAEIGRIISSTLNIEEVYERFAQEVQKLISVDRCVFTIINSEDRTATTAYASGIKIPSRLPGEVFPLPGSATEMAEQARSGLIIPTEDENEVAAQVPGLLPVSRAGIRSVMMIPLISRDEVIGVLNLQSIKPKAYTEKELRIAERVGNQIAGAIASARLYSGLKEAKETLQKKEEEFRELYDHAPLGYHEYNREGKITRVNKTDLEMLGYTAEEMIGQPMWKFNVGEDFVKEQILAKLAGRLPPGKNLVRIYRRKDGGTFPVLIEDRLIKDERGEIIGIRCTIQDITERKRAEEALRQNEKELTEQAQELQKELIQRRRVEDELARSNKELGQFAYVASHDLQEPLRMVTSYVQLLARHYRGKLDGDADEFIGFAVNGAARMQQLINDLLTYSRVGTKGREFEPTDCEIVLQQSLKNLQIAIEEKQAIVSHDPLPTVMGDNVQLGQLFQNLIGNAIKFQGTEPPHVHVSASRNGNGWVFSIRDNGIGIAPEYAERIFVIFRRLHSLEKYPGTGIGLAVCKKIVERHGGRIWVESESGKGAIFYFTLPGKGEQ
jgi:PAS domain S-box-containing protein